MTLTLQQSHILEWHSSWRPLHEILLWHCHKKISYMSVMLRRHLEDFAYLFNRFKSWHLKQKLKIAKFRPNSSTYESLPRDLYQFISIYIQVQCYHLKGNWVAVSSFQWRYFENKFCSLLCLSAVLLSTICLLMSMILYPLTRLVNWSAVWH